MASGISVITIVLQDDGGTDNGGVDTSPPQAFTITITKPHPWYDTREPLDVNADLHISSIDALLVINYLNNKLPTNIAPTAAIGPPFLDTNRDNNVSSIDALLVINAINNGLGGEGEGGQAAAAALDWSDTLAVLAADTAAQVRRRRTSR